METKRKKMEVYPVFRPLVRVIFLGKAAFEVGRERVEDAVDALTAKAGEYKSTGTERLTESKDQAKQIASELYQQVWQRSEVLESQAREKLKRHVADFSLDALGDATEINELRAELATLRAEIAELKTMKAAV
jgi:polyhydroxyalkanoate synthesis regulator phasin